MKAYERFLKYVSVWTTSDETSETVPSAERELVLAKILVDEMKEIGTRMPGLMRKDMCMERFRQLPDARMCRLLD